MGLPRSTYYDAPPVKTDDAEIVANITAICDEFEAYGYRRVGAGILDALPHWDYPIVILQRAQELDSIMRRF